MNSSKSIAAIGECMLELSREGDGWRMGYAGDTFNTLWTSRALLPGDWTADYVSAFGDDPFSADQTAFFARAGIGTASSPIIPNLRPGLYAITLDGAERSFSYWRNESAARRLADDPALLADSLSARSLVVFSGITLAILEPAARRTLLDAAAMARKGGSLVAFDPNYRPRLWSGDRDARGAFDAALALADIALPTFSDEAMLYGDPDAVATIARLRGLGVEEIVVKDGAEPAILWADGQRHSAPVPAVEPVDTTGAGDAFNGGYLAARLLGMNPAEAVGRANRAAAATVQVRGALAPADVLREAWR